MRPSEATILNLLKGIFPSAMPAREIVRRTKLSFSTVRAAVNKLYGDGFLERQLDIGLNGHTLYEWYWSGKSAPQHGQVRG